MAILRTDIEKALDELIANEEGMRFQSLAVILAKQKWPDLIASERHKDGGLDAYVPASVAQDKKAKGLATSITATITKIKDDATKIKNNFPDVEILFFATAKPVTNSTVLRWVGEIRDEFGYELVVITREEVITSLMMPSNAPLCRTILAIDVPNVSSDIELLGKVRQAVAEEAQNWRTRTRAANRPIVSLRAVKFDGVGKETSEILDTEGLRTSLAQARRITLEAPGGGGKTTMLIQLATEAQPNDGLLFLIDLPVWVQSRTDILEFIARTRPFRSRGIEAAALARLYQSEHFSFLLNGWNEITDIHSAEAAVSLRELERSFPEAGIVVATRTHHITPPLPGSFRAKLLPFNRRQRADYLDQTLCDRANELRLRLEGSRVLDALTRTPLILAEVVTIFQSGGPIPTTRIGVLDAVMNLIEKSDEHRPHLQLLSLADHAHHYLEELAAAMTGRGEVNIADEAARSIIQFVSTKLRDNKQIAALPDPMTVLNALCAHHVLERLEYPSVAFRFQHQQFQEFYAARFLADALEQLVQRCDHTADRAFAASYINKPMCGESLFMVAEAIRLRSEEDQPKKSALASGGRLINLALGVDPILAADLSRLSGPIVWGAVREQIDKCVRDWYVIGDRYHRQCAIAAMLATGSADFADILGPLLTDKDREVRMSTYEAGDTFYPTSLGSDWRGVVDGWDEDSRADFVFEVTHRAGMVETGESFATNDPSEKVRMQAIESLCWIGATDALTRILNALDDTALEAALPALFPEIIPGALRRRLVAANRRLLQHESEPLDRIRRLLKGVELGDVSTVGDLKVELDRLPPPPLDQHAAHAIAEALKIIRKRDQGWASTWVTARLLDGSLWGEHWQPFLTAMPQHQVYDLINKLATEELSFRGASGIRMVLSASATPALAKQIFAKLCELQRVISAGGAARLAWNCFDQLQKLLRAIPVEAAVAGMMEWVAGPFDADSFHVAAHLFGWANADAPELKSALPDPLRQSLRRYVKDGISELLAHDLFDDATRAHAAIALARVGGTDDLADLRRLIDADIQRRRVRSNATNYSNWYQQALLTIEAQGVDVVFINLLSEPRYEDWAARGLLQLALPPDRQKTFQKNIYYEAIWLARTGTRSPGFDEGRAKRSAQAIKHRISALREQRVKASQPDQFPGRLKSLAFALANLDGRDNADFVLEVLALPGQWDEYVRMNGIKALLLSGALLTLDSMLAVLDPVIEHLLSQGLYRDQSLSLLIDCLELLPFSDDPSRAMERIEEVRSRFQHQPYHFRDLVTAVGYSRAGAAVGFLLNFARGAGAAPNMDHAWIEALVRLDVPAARRVLLSFIDPEIPWMGITITFDFRSVELFASHVAEWARHDPDLKQRLFALSANPLTAMQQQLLPVIYAHIDIDEGLLACVNIVQGNMVPLGFGHGFESVFLERRSYDNSNSFNLVPRNAGEVRAKLYQMVLNDPQRRRAAFSILGQVEVWRLEYGRPNGEPRHPMIESGEPWPPISYFQTASA